MAFPIFPPSQQPIRRSPVIMLIQSNAKYQPQDSQKHLDTIIEKRKAQLPALLAVHKEISNYMSALGELANDDLVSYDESINSLSTNLGAMKNKDGNQVIKNEQIDAFVALGKILSKAATDAYRQKEITILIQSSNRDFQILINTLKEYIQIGYIESLINEEKAAEKYYQDVIRTAEHNPPQQAAIELVRDKLIERADAIKAKKEAAESYLKILEKIAKGHQLLYDKSSDVSSQKLLAAINGYRIDISNLYSAVNSLR